MHHLSVSDFEKVRSDIVNGFWTYLEHYYLRDAAFAKLAQACKELDIPSDDMPDNVDEFISEYTKPQLLATLDQWKAFLDRMKFATSEAELLEFLKGAHPLIDQLNSFKKPLNTQPTPVI